MSDVVKTLRKTLDNGPHDTYEVYDIAHEALTAVQSVMEVHKKTEHQRSYGYPKADQWEHYCLEDNQSWPCATVQVIIDALENVADLQALQEARAEDDGTRISLENYLKDKK